MSVSLGPSSWVSRILDRGTLSYLMVWGWSPVFWSRCERALVCQLGQRACRQLTNCAGMQCEPLLQLGCSLVPGEGMFVSSTVLGGGQTGVA